MKKSLYFLGVMAIMALLPMQAAAQAYELRVLTFEDEDVKEENRDGSLDVTGEVGGVVWSDFIDPVQFQGSMLYGGSGSGEYYPYYGWYDFGNTGIMHMLCDGYGSYCYWSGGHAISHYWTNKLEDVNGYGTDDYKYVQLTVYRENASIKDLEKDGEGDDVAIERGGHNGSDNFAVHYGYIDWFNSSQYGVTSTPSIALEERHIIDHMYVANNVYAMGCYAAGNFLTEAIGPDDYMKIVAYGYYDASDYETDKSNNCRDNATTSEFYLVQGADAEGNVLAVVDWAKWDLTELGEVELVEFNMEGSNDNGFGLSQPAYFAYDDVAVRFELDEADIPETFTRDGLTVGNYGTICLPRGAQVSACTGAEFYKPVAKTSEELILEEVSELVAGEGYIFKATDSKLTVTYSTDYVSEPKAASAANAMQGVYIKTTIPAGKYFIGGGQVKVSTGLQYAGANRAYIDLSKVPAKAPAQVGRRVSMAIEETTGWNSVKDDTKVTKVLKNGVIYIQHNGHTYDVMGNLVK